MPKIQPDYSEASKPIHPGTYLCRVISAEEKIGKSSGNKYINWKLETEPEKNILFYSTPIEGRGAGMFKHFVRCIDKNYGGGEYDTDELIGQVVSAELDIEDGEYNGRKYMRFKVVNLDAPTMEQLEKLKQPEEDDLGF